MVEAAIAELTKLVVAPATHLVLAREHAGVGVAGHDSQEAIDGGMIDGIGELIAPELIV